MARQGPPCRGQTLMQAKRILTRGDYRPFARDFANLGKEVVTRRAASGRLGRESSNCDFPRSQPLTPPQTRITKPLASQCVGHALRMLVVMRRRWPWAEQSILAPKAPSHRARPRSATVATAPASGPQPTDASQSAERDQSLQGLDAVGRLTMLRKAFEARPEQVPDAKPNPWAEQWADQVTRLKQLFAEHRSRLLKVLVGALVVVAVGWLPARTLLQTTSTEAVLNARLVTLRAPIEGEIGPGLGTLAAGTQLEPGDEPAAHRQQARRPRPPRRPAPAGASAGGRAHRADRSPRRPRKALRRPRRSKPRPSRRDAAASSKRACRS